MSELLYKEEVFKLVGYCMEVHRELGLLMNFGADSLEWKRVIRGQKPKLAELPNNFHL